MAGAVIFPHNIGLGCTRDASLVERVARATAEEVAATGIDWTFSPCIAVARDERWGRTYESFGETPELVSEMAAAAVRGTQPTILACAKHYLADGGTAGGRDQGDAQMDEATLRAIHLPGYRAAVAAGVGSVMASFSSWNGQKMHGHRYLITDVLKGELGFQGFVVSDWAGIDQLPGDYASDVETSINAGIDMVMVPDRYPEFVATLKSLVQSGRVPQARIDDAVRRILRQKIALGLWEKPYADRALLPQVGSDAHRQVGREAVRKSLVLLKNEGRVLPLSKMTRRIHVAGRNADDLGNQCGGWTITWQGGSGAITTGTTILQGIRAGVLGGASVTYSRDGSGAEGADVGVVVIGETPYAEGVGDRTDLSLSAEDVAAVRAVRSGRHPDGRGPRLGPAADPGRDPRRRRRDPRRLAARHRGRGRRRRALRRLRAHGQAVALLAAHDGPGPDQLGRRRLRSALPLRLRPVVLTIAPRSVISRLHPSRLAMAVTVSSRGAPSVSSLVIPRSPVPVASPPEELRPSRPVIPRSLVRVDLSSRGASSAGRRGIRNAFALSRRLCLNWGSPAGLVAQLVEQRTENPRVGGSTPSQATNPINN